MKDKITIGLFDDSFFPMLDGVCMVVDNYARRLINYANVIVFVPEVGNGEFDDSQLPYKVVRCKSVKAPIIDYSVPLPKLDIKFIKELEKYELDIIHIHSPFMMGELGIKYAKKHNIPVVATMHTQFKQDFRRAVRNERLATLLTNKMIKLFNKCDECWAVNAEVARIFYEEYKYKTMPVVMNNATEMKPVPDYEKACDTINQLHGINKDDIVFLFVGRINSLKNIFLIAESLRILKELDGNLNFKMLFVGSGQDENALHDMIKREKMEDKIIMCGRVSDRDLLAYYYARADLFLFPSLYDASSIVQIESASQKTPCLFIEGAATAINVKDNVNGFLSKNDANEYANRILQIVKDKDLLKNVSENCHKDLYINWDDAVKEVYERYIELIKNKEESK